MKKGSAFMAVIVFVIGFALFGGSTVPTFGQTTDDRPLRITSKPRPAYTDEARKAGVQGTVELAITFSADGTIGEVVCAIENQEKREQFEKYGLVESAINAARKIQFDPEIKGGKAITVTKKYSYTFAIY